MDVRSASLSPSNGKWGNGSRAHTRLWLWLSADCCKGLKNNRNPPILAFEKYLKSKGILFHSDQIWSFPISGICLKYPILNYCLAFIHRTSAIAHNSFENLCSAAALSRREGAGRRREDPVFAANIPFKVALFAALTGHEYQAEGAEGAADAITAGGGCRLLRAPCDLILSSLFHGMSVMRCSRCIHANGGVKLWVLSNTSRFWSLGGGGVLQMSKTSKLTCLCWNFYLELFDWLKWK